MKTKTDEDAEVIAYIQAQTNDDGTPLNPNFGEEIQAQTNDDGITPLNPNFGEEIRLRAYQIYEERVSKGVEASPEQDWYKAVEELSNSPKG